MMTAVLAFVKPGPEIESTSIHLLFLKISVNTNPEPARHFLVISKKARASLKI